MMPKLFNRFVWRMLRYLTLVGVMALFIHCGGSSNEDDLAGLTGNVEIRSTGTNGEGEINGETLVFTEATAVEIELCEFIDYDAIRCGVDTTSTQNGHYTFSSQEEGIYFAKARITDLIEAKGDTTLLEGNKQVILPTVLFGPYPRHQGTFLKANRLPFPNSFSGEITLFIEVKDPLGTNPLGDLTIQIYDVTGKEVIDLSKSNILPGAQEISWNGHDANDNPMPAGVYFYVVTWENEATSDFERYVGNFFKR